MNLTRLSILALAGAFLMVSASAHAQCYTDTTLYCVTPSCSNHTFAMYPNGSNGQYNPASPLGVKCCGVFYSTYSFPTESDCFIVKNLDDAKENRLLARSIAHNRAFAVACNGDLVPYSGKSQKEQPWSANRALAEYERKLLTQVR